MGDIQYEAFISPSAPGPVTWGVGPYLNFPTATDKSLGSGKWSAGPALLVLAMPGQWVVGGLLTQLWSFAGNGDSTIPDVSTMSIQLFANYNIPESGGWYITSSVPATVINWKADAGEKWSIPLGGGIGKMTLMKKSVLMRRFSFTALLLLPPAVPPGACRFRLNSYFPKGTRNFGIPETERV